MKYRILIAGGNRAVIDFLFENMGEDYELVTTTVRSRDIDTHVRLFKPDMFICCLKNERPEQLRCISELSSGIISAGIDVAVVGSREDYAGFQHITSDLAGLFIDSDRPQAEIVSAIAEFSKQHPESAQEQEDKRNHVLVIDDDPQMLRTIKGMLNDRYDVATAVSGRMAYTFLDKRKTDIILLDFEMPDENGLQVLTKLRERPELENIPVLFLTGNTDRDKIKQAIALNPQGYLVKPINRAELTDSIRKLIG